MIEAIDRDSIVRLVYRSHAVPISVPMSPSNSFWFDRSLPRPVRSLSQARETLRKGGFTWSSDGSLRDTEGKTVEFSLLVNTANPQQQEIGVLIQQDLKELGIRVTLNTLEFRSVLHRIFSSFDYDAAILTLVGYRCGSEYGNERSAFNRQQSRLESEAAADSRLADGDRLTHGKTADRSFSERAEAIVRSGAGNLCARNKPAIFLTSPNVLVGAKNEIGNFHPAKLQDYTLWNADQLFKSGQQRTNGR